MDGKNMIVKSMTGFGRGEITCDGKTWTAEIRCVNNRFLDLKIKLPKSYVSLEDMVRKKVSSILKRGRVDIVLNVQGDFSDLRQIHVNGELVKRYHNAFSEIADTLGIENDIGLSQLVNYPDVIQLEQQGEDVELVWEKLECALDQALQQCDIMRIQEGKCLAADLTDRLVGFVAHVDAIEQSIPSLIEKREADLKERLAKLLDGVELDPVRLSQEVAILVDKTDVTEEIVRLRSHINQFEAFLQEGGEKGRKLDFLIQEFLREVNTLGSKINNSAVAHIIVELKGELEKMREQVQNLE